MFSMTATAPSSCKHRRTSPKVTPTKPTRSTIPYGRHSPHPTTPTARGHARRHSDAAGAPLPPMMPLDPSNGNNASDAHLETKGEMLLRERGRETARAMFRNDDNNRHESGVNHHGLSGVEDCVERMNYLVSEDETNVGTQSQTQTKHVFRPDSNPIQSDNHARIAIYNDLDEGDEYFDRPNHAHESPTERNLPMMDSLHDNDSGYKRSASTASMEPQFDISTRGKSLLTLKTVFSADCDDGEADDPTTEEEQTFIHNSMGRDAYETCSSTNGVFIDDGDQVNGLKSYQRSSSMQPIFDRGSNERLIDSDPTEEVNMTDTLTPVEETSPGIDAGKRKSLSNPSSPIVYKLSSRPASPLLSDIYTEINNPVENDAFGRVCVQLTGVSLSYDSGSDIGGDTYFDRTMGNDSASDVGGDAYFDRDPEEDATKGENENSIEAGNSKDDELMQPIALPPRLKRTTTNSEAEDMNMALEFPLTPARAGQNGGISPSPRRNFANTHSLMDDCSDDEDEITSFQMVDSPTRHRHSYSCFPKREHATNQHNSPIVSYLNFKKHKHNRNQSNSFTNTVGGTVDNSIQQALLKTRHRRWTCQSAIAGSHAQSNQVFDVSNRVQHIAVWENKMNWNYRRNCDLRFIEEENPECMDDGPMIMLSRMSVPNAALRAGALACGLWRTVRLVRLPKGLFEKHWLLWKEKKSSFEEVYDENDVWAVLQMLRETFPLLDQIDFGGDIGAATNDKEMADDRKEWKKEIVSRMLQILPNLIAIDGFDVDKTDLDVGPINQAHEDFVPMQTEVPMRSGDTNLEDCATEDCTAVAAGTICEPVDVQLCGWTNLIETQAQSIQKKFNFDVAENLHSGSVEVEAISSFTAPKQCSVVGNISSDAIDHVAENLLSMIETCANPKHKRQKSDTCHYPPLESESHESLEKDTDQLLASPMSSNSWDGTSGNRPPICPGSSQRRILSKPLERKKSKGSMLKASLKRRVLGLIPTVSVMDEEEDSDDNEDVECPADLL